VGIAGTARIRQRVGDRHALDPGWLNDAVNGYLPGLVVRVASPRFVVAMKLLASRVERDEDDIRVLLRLSNIAPVVEALDLVLNLYPSAAIPSRVEYMVRELLLSPASRSGSSVLSEPQSGAQGGIR